jgi:hypothetical protein
MPSRLRDPQHYAALEWLEPRNKITRRDDFLVEIADQPKGSRSIIGCRCQPTARL